MPVTVDGAAKAATALGGMPGALRGAVRADVATDVVGPLVQAVKAAAGRSGPYGRHIAPSVRAEKGTEPMLVVGSTRRTGLSGGATVNQLLYGTEYGSAGSRYTTYQRSSPRGQRHPVRRRTTRMFRPGGYGFFADTLTANETKMWQAWEAAAFDPLARMWGTGG